MARLLVIGLVAVLATAASTARSQTLEFDGVCAAPPCAAGGLYAAAGVTISPANLNIVASNTGLLVGTNGGRYLFVNPAPFQATLSLARTATFVSVDVARNQFVGPGQVTLQALNNGANVGSPQVVTVAGGNVWSNVAISLPGGFNGIRIGSDAQFGVDNVRIGGNCSGFADVLPADIFCNAVEWLYNRGVTFGCLLGQYCPGGNVTRAQMALFMQRLGVALTPTVLFDYDSLIGDPNAGPGGMATVCSVAHAPTQPSSARAVATLNTANSDSNAIIAFHVEYSIDAGVTWSSFTGTSHQTTASTSGGHDTQTLVTPAISLQTGKTYWFAGRTLRLSPASPITVAMTCSLQIIIDNANPSAAPFDAATGARASAPPR